MISDFNFVSHRPGTTSLWAVVAVAALLLVAPLQAADGQSTVGQSTLGQSLFGQSPIARAALISNVAMIEPGTPFRVALRLVLPDGWHTYWRNPGESGVPTTLRWSLPNGFTAGPVVWPAPMRIALHDVVNFGYYDEVWLFNEIVPPADLKPGTDVRLMADAEWAVCSDVCIPEVATLTMWMRVGGDVPVPATPWAATFEAEAAALPVAAPAATVRFDDTEVTLEMDVRGLDVPSDSAAFFFAAPFGVIEPSASQRSSRDGDTVTVTAERSARGAPPSDGRVDGVVVFKTETDRRAYTVDASIEN